MLKEYIYIYIYMYIYIYRLFLVNEMQSGFASEENFISFLEFHSSEPWALSTYVRTYRAVESIRSAPILPTTHRSVTTFLPDGSLMTPFRELLEVADR